MLSVLTIEPEVAYVTVRGVYAHISSATCPTECRSELMQVIVRHSVVPDTLKPLPLYFKSFFFKLLN